MAYSLVERVRLKPESDEYQRIRNYFNVKNTTKKHRLEIESIEKVYNDLLMEKFESKKKEYEERYGYVREVEVFHGTKKTNISSILQSNLDVNRHGQNVGHRFGAGVSFSAYASYASYYCDNPDSANTMLVCKVLVSNIVEVPESRNNLAVLQEPPYIPHKMPMRYDTTAKCMATMSVIVKFENDTYYPSHMIYFKRRPHSQQFTVDDDTENLIRKFLGLKVFSTQY